MIHPAYLTEPLDYLACHGTVECHRDYLRVDDAFVRVLTLKTPPAQTFAYQLEAIYNIPTSFVLCITWQPASADVTRRLLRRQRRHHHQGKISLLTYFQSEAPQAHEVLVDDSATAMVQQLGEAATQLDVHGHAFGRCAISMTLAGSTRGALDRATTLVSQAFSTADMTLLVERYGLLQAWLSCLPGGDIYQLRWFWLSDLNHADLSAIFGVASGEWNAHLKAEYLALFESNQRTLYRLNLHHQDVGHALILGSTGSGKSFLACYLATHAQRYAASTIIFDLGGSYRRLTEQFGGGYLKMDLANPEATLNPFALPPSPEHLSFLASFVRLLIGDGRDTLTSYEQGELWDQVQNIYTLAPPLRRLSTLAAMLPRSLEIPLRPWVEGGQYALAFDHVEDSVTFRHFHAIDFEGLDRHPALLRPIHYYLAYRVSTLLTADPSQWGLWLIDESWKYLPQTWFHQDIREALKTWRRKNVSVVLVTQSADDLSENGMLRLALEACRTRILLANQGFDTEMGVNQFGLSHRAADAVLKLAPRQQLLIQRPEVTKVLNLHVSESERWLYSLASSVPSSIG
jgi:type IV secretion system protein VirB4